MTAATSRRGTSPHRRQLLARCQPLADGVATLFFPYAEVVVHDLQTQTVAYLANNLSKRVVGDASALDDTHFDAAETLIGPYEKRNWDGCAMRSVSVVIRDERETPIGLVCINLNIAVFEQARAALDLFVSGTRVVPQPEKLFRDDWQERINTFLHTWMQKRQLALTTLTREHKRQLVADLYGVGAFSGKSAANYIANVLGMGRATVFKHLKALRAS